MSAAPPTLLFFPGRREDDAGMVRWQSWRVRGIRCRPAPSTNRAVAARVPPLRVVAIISCAFEGRRGREVCVCVCGNRVKAPLAGHLCVRCAVGVPREDKRTRTNVGARKGGILFHLVSNDGTAGALPSFAPRHLSSPPSGALFVFSLSPKKSRFALIRPPQEGTLCVRRGYAHCLARARTWTRQ